jgi:NADH-quinone oxidoreductase subunit N
VVLSLSLLSLAGLPLTIGFIGKFFVVSAGVGAGQYFLVGALAEKSVKVLPS